MNILKRASFAFAILVSSLFVYADDYVAVAKEGKVFDDASPKYVTLNEKNDEVIVSPGMVFKTTEHLPGWYLIEYSPGLHGYIPEPITATSFNTPTPGTYEVKNNPGHKLTVTASGNDWKGSIDGKTFKGSRVSDVVIFFNDSGNLAFSLIDLGQGAIVMSYDNALTKFF